MNKVINFNDIKAKKRKCKLSNPEDEMLQCLKDVFDSNLEELQKKSKKGEDFNGDTK